MYVVCIVHRYVEISKVTISLINKFFLEEIQLRFSHLFNDCSSVMKLQEKISYFLLRII